MASDYSGSDCSPDATVAQEARPRVFISRCPLSIELKNAVQALAKSVRHDQEVSGQLILLAAKSMAESKNWSTVAISQESWAKLFMVRAQIMSEGAQVSFPCYPGALSPEILGLTRRHQIAARFRRVENQSRRRVSVGKGHGRAAEPGDHSSEELPGHG